MKFRYVFLFMIAGLFIGKAFIDIFDGESAFLGKEIMTRAERKENPKEYWNNIVLNGIIGLGIFSLTQFLRNNQINT